MFGSLNKPNTGEIAERNFKQKFDDAMGGREGMQRMAAALLSGTNNRDGFARGFGAMADNSARGREKAKTDQMKMQQMQQLKSMGASDQELQAIEAGLISPDEIYRTKTAPAQERKTLKGADGYSYYQDDQSRVLPGVQASGSKQSSGIQEFEYAKQQGFEGDYIAFQNAKKGKGFSVTTADGTVVQMGGSDGPPEMKEAQAKANLFASRMEQSNQILESLENEGTDLGQKLMSGVPIVGNYGITSEHRQYDQAKRDFLNAVLRQESGAVIADTEFANGDKQYFPQPGDDPQTIAQKKENRRIAMQAIRQASAQPETNPTGMPSPNDMDFSKMSDEELEAIANGS